MAKLILFQKQIEQKKKIIIKIKINYKIYYYIIS
jgi:hypothetical protein